MKDPTDVASVPYGQRVRTLRLARGLSQQNLASRAGLAIRTLARIEAGEDTTLGTLSAVAGVLDVPLAELVAA